MSGIYIPGMEMPIRCGLCFAWDEEYSTCNLTLDHRTRLEKVDDCPLIPVPDHGRLIDKDALEQDISDSVVFSGRENNPEIYGANKIINRIHHAPTIIGADKEAGE